MHRSLFSTGFLFEKEISTQTLGFKVMQELKKLDDVAYVRFASVYKTFKDVHEFVETLNAPPPISSLL